jgi:hypothetical protein
MGIRDLDVSSGGLMGGSSCFGGSGSGDSLFFGGRRPDCPEAVKPSLITSTAAASSSAMLTRCERLFLIGVP